MSKRQELLTIIKCYEKLLNIVKPKLAITYYLQQHSVLLLIIKGIIP